MSSIPGGSLQPGQVLLGRYRILGVIGQGGMGAVYQAQDLRFPHVTRLCAVKEMINSAQDQQVREQTMRYFEREAEMLATLSHPAIPEIYDYFSFGGCAYLVQEFIQGRDLATLMDSKDAFFPADQVREWGIEICDVLSYLHNYQPEPIIFRDMKPSNVMIDHLQKVRLIDFGIARAFQPNTKVTTVGTQGYAPPELYDGKADARSDIYSLGATLHHLLTRSDPQVKRPFTFDERPIRDFNPAVPEALAAVIMRALNNDPEQRYASAEAMKQSLIGSRLEIVPLPSSAPVVKMNTKQNGNNGGVTDKEAQPILMPDPSVEPIWSFLVEDAVRCGPLIHNGVVYFGACDNNLWALDAKNGNLKWKFATEGPIDSSPTYSGGAVYIGSSDHRLYAIDVRTGQCLWRFKTEGEIHTKPAAAVGLIFVGSNDGKLYGVKPGPNSARKMWEFNFMSPIRSSPVVENDRIFFGSDEGQFVCLNITGEEVWRFTGRRGILSTALIKNHMIYIGANDRVMYALDIDHPQINWQFQTRGEVIASAAYGDHKIFFGSTDGIFYALASDDGHPVWRYKVGEPINSSPFVHGESVYFGAMNGAVYSLHIKSGDLLWRFQTKGPVVSSPTVVDNIVYFGSDDGYMYALPA